MADDLHYDLSLDFLLFESPPVDSSSCALCARRQGGWPGQCRVHLQAQGRAGAPLLQTEHSCSLPGICTESARGACVQAEEAAQRAAAQAIVLANGDAQADEGQPMPNGHAPPPPPGAAEDDMDVEVKAEGKVKREEESIDMELEPEEEPQAPLPPGEQHSSGLRLCSACLKVWCAAVSGVLRCGNLLAAMSQFRGRALWRVGSHTPSQG